MARSFLRPRANTADLAPATEPLRNFLINGIFFSLLIFVDNITVGQVSPVLAQFNLLWRSCLVSAEVVEITPV